LTFRHTVYGDRNLKWKAGSQLYRLVNRGKTMYQIAFYTAGRRVQKNFRSKSKAKRVADQILHGLTIDTEAVEFFLRHRPTAIEQTAARARGGFTAEKGSG